MKGQPPLQALLLLVLLAIAGLAGSVYISPEPPPAPPAPEPSSDTCGHTTAAEIEFIFSSKPQSYTLRKPSDKGGDGEVLLHVTTPEQNPDYRDVQLPAHGGSSYWLDVVWPADAGDGQHHIVRVNISPDHGEGAQYSFFSSTREMNETFDYTSAHSHE